MSTLPFTASYFRGLPIRRMFYPPLYHLRGPVFGLDLTPVSLDLFPQEVDVSFTLNNGKPDHDE